MEAHAFLSLKYCRLGICGHAASGEELHTQSVGSMVPLSTIQQCEYYVNLDSKIHHKIIKANSIQKSAKCWCAVIENLTAPARGVLLVS